MRRAVNTHLVAWSVPRTEANQGCVTKVLRKHNSREWNTWESDHTGTMAKWQRGDASAARAFSTYFLQEFALDPQLPRGHLLRLLALGLAGGVRVGDVDPELAFLLCDRDKQAVMSVKNCVNSFHIFTAFK